MALQKVSFEHKTRATCKPWPVDGSRGQELVVAVPASQRAVKVFLSFIKLAFSTININCHLVIPFQIMSLKVKRVASLTATHLSRFSAWPGFAARRHALKRASPSPVADEGQVGSGIHAGSDTAAGTGGTAQVSPTTRALNGDEE